MEGMMMAPAEGIGLNENSLNQLEMEGEPEDCGEDLPEAKNIPPTPTQEPITSQEILMIEDSSGNKIQLGSQLITPKGLLPLAITLYDHLKKDNGNKSKEASYLG
jgi:hypothetical protein